MKCGRKNCGCCKGNEPPTNNPDPIITMIVGMVGVLVGVVLAQLLGGI